MAAPDPVVVALREIRRRRRLSQREVADWLGFGPGAVRDWELGRYSPKLEVLRRLAHLLGYEVHIRLVPIRRLGDRPPPPSVPRETGDR